MIKASDLLVKALVNEGVQRIYGLPGEENLDLMESIRKSGIEFILARHEQAAGFMAATEGRLNGSPGVCLSTLGPGAANLVNAAAFAQLGAMPMVMITGQKPITKSKQAGFQLFDVVDMMQPVTKSAKTIINASEIAYDIREAFRMAAAERPGAVHLELPEDIAAQSVEDDSTVTVKPEQLPQASPDHIGHLLQRLKSAKRPLVLIGAGANRKPVCQALAKFVEKVKIPFFNTQMGKGVIDERNALFMGTAALTENDTIHEVIESADLIINVGHDYVEKPPFIMKPGGMEVVHVNYTSSQVDQLYFPQFELIGDIAANLNQLTESADFTKAWTSTSEQPNKQFTDASGSGIPPSRIVEISREQIPDNGIITLDNGMYKIWYARNYPAYHPNTVLLDNALATMGAGLPAAIAAKLRHPDRKVVAICGDGGFMMNSQELETAVRLKLNLTILILCDDQLGMIRWKQEEMGFEDYALSFKNPDFEQYAQSYGAKGYTATNEDQMREKLQYCLQAEGINVLVVPIDYSQNQDL